LARGGLRASNNNLIGTKDASFTAWIPTIRWQRSPWGRIANRFAAAAAQRQNIMCFLFAKQQTV